MKRGQGFLFSIEIIEDFIKFRVLGFIPWAKVKLEEVEYMRISSKSEYYDCVGAGEKALYWPIMIWGYSKRMAPIYMLERSRDGKKFFSGPVLHFTTSFALKSAAPEAMGSAITTPPGKLSWMIDSI